MKLLLFAGRGRELVALAEDDLEEAAVLGEASEDHLRLVAELTITVESGNAHRFPTGRLWVAT